jgi:hypothetical protein
MKKVSPIITALAIMLVSVLCVQCTKEGPVGPAGAIGPQGPQGVTGAKGETGNANVITKLITVNPTDWVSANSSGSKSYQAYKPLAELTASVNDAGLVVAYMSFYDKWCAMPYIATVPLTTSVYTVTFNFRYKTGEMTFVRNDSDNIPIAPVSAITFKVVIVPPVIKMMYPKVNWDKPQSVQDFLKVNPQLIIEG